VAGYRRLKKLGLRLELHLGIGSAPAPEELSEYRIRREVEGCSYEEYQRMPQWQIEVDVLCYNALREHGKIGPFNG
jgi:hypothetical protein